MFEMLPIELIYLFVSVFVHFSFTPLFIYDFVNSLCLFFLWMSFFNWNIYFKVFNFLGNNIFFIINNTSGSAAFKAKFDCGRTDHLNEQFTEQIIG